MIKKLFFVCIAVLLMAVIAPLNVIASDYEAQIDELSSKYDELEKQQEALQAEIDKAKTEKDKMIAEKNQIDTQISTTRNQIALLNNKIDLLEESIAAKEQEIVEINGEISVSYDLFKDRMYTMYVTPKNSTLSLLLGSKDFTSFLNSAEYATRIAERDQELLDDMRDELELMIETQKEIEDNKTAVEGDKEIVAEKEVELGEQLEQVEEEIQDISLLEQEYAANKAKYDAEMLAIEADIQKIYDLAAQEGQLSPDYAGGSMAWPVPGHTYISSNFGWRFSGTDYHTGFDIAGTGSDGKGIYGKPIVAANSGKVIFTNTSYVQGRGYGIYLIIDHGGGISTLYGHTSKLAVKTGDYVTKGQTVAYVGSTGWSTGPHLHFEVRKDGIYVYPWDYISKPY